MAWAPMVQDRRGEYYAAGLNAVGAGIGRGLEARYQNAQAEADRLKREQEKLKEEEQRAAKLRRMAKDLGIEGAQSLDVGTLEGAIEAAQLAESRKFRQLQEESMKLAQENQRFRLSEARRRGVANEGFQQYLQENTGHLSPGMDRANANLEQAQRLGLNPLTRQTLGFAGDPFQPRQDDLSTMIGRGLAMGADVDVPALKAMRPEVEEPFGLEPAQAIPGLDGFYAVKISPNSFQVVPPKDADENVDPNARPVAEDLPGAPEGATWWRMPDGKYQLVRNKEMDPFQAYLMGRMGISPSAPPSVPAGGSDVEEWSYDASGRRVQK